MKKMMNLSLHAFLIGVCVLAITVSFSGKGIAAQKELKIGVLGVMSGPAASWGLVCKYSTMATARMYNEKGGVLIDGERYKIKVIAIDDKNDPKLAVAGAERLIYKEGIKYIVGPNIDPTATSVVPVLEAGKAINTAYCFAKEIYSPPHNNTIFGMVGPWQVNPIMLSYMKEKDGVNSMSFITWNVAEGIHTRDDMIKIAKDYGIKILSKDVTFEPNTTDFFPHMSKIVPGNPDAIGIMNPPAAAAPLVIKAARELGYKGRMYTLNAGMDIAPMNEIAGAYANGFLTPGGASSPEIRSKYMEDFIKVYKDIAGEWNDEAGTKVYALETYLATLKLAGKAALKDVEIFKAAMPKLSIRNPFLKEDRVLKFVGEKWFGQNSQIAIPIVMNEVRDGEFKMLFVQPVE